VVDRLSARGLVTATSDPHDKRRRAVTLTDEGRRVTESAIKIAARITADTLVPLTEEERRTIARLLKKLA
jgi:DNA-binding MarR family transcriptional regulator